MDPATELASNFTVERYAPLRDHLVGAALDEKAWAEVISAIRRRVQERFLTPVRELSRFDEQDELPYRPGFAILALDCLLIDTIQSFREGRVTTGNVSPAKSFKTFLSSPRFADFKATDRGDFFQYVRNGIFHNGETRKNWKIRIDNKRMLDRDGTTETTTINRQLFHAAVEQEFHDLISLLESGDVEVRQNFLRRLDAMSGIPTDPLKNFYFAYGSNLKDVECLRTATGAQSYGVAFLPCYRLAFTKCSTTRRGDAANIHEDPGSMVWGYVYRVSDGDREALKEREGGYKKITVTVHLGPPKSEDYPTPLTAFTFAASATCAQKCGPRSDYLQLLIEGAKERGLPEAYQETIRAAGGAATS
jgi:cation transport regulator ChaC